MTDLLLAFTFLALLRMPFQENYWFWKIVGFSGLGVFQARWVVQWLYSEKHKESRVPSAFWWLSLTGAFIETCYFIRQRDSVGIAGYCVSFVPYTRNLMFIYRKKHQDAEAARLASDRTQVDPPDIVNE